MYQNKILWEDMSFLGIAEDIISRPVDNLFSTYRDDTLP